MTKLDYNEMAAAYASNRRVHPGVLRAIIEEAGVTASTQVLEIGCGTGNYLTAIQQATGCRAIGVDPSSAMLANARAQAATATWLQGSGEAIPLPDGSCDLLFSVDVIHHIRDRAAFFREAARVLVPGTLLCTATDSHADIATRRPLASYFPETVTVDQGRYPAIETLQAEADSAGLHDRGAQHVEATYPLTDLQPYRARAYSCLHLIGDEAWQAGLARLEADAAAGLLEGCSMYTLVWATR